MISEYLDSFMSHSGSRMISEISNDKLEHIINTLEYNDILIYKSTIRDEKINNILK